MWYTDDTEATSSINAHPLNSEIVGRTVYCCPSFIYRDAVGRSRDRSCAPPIGQSPCLRRPITARCARQSTADVHAHLLPPSRSHVGWPAYQVSTMSLHWFCYSARNARIVSAVLATAIPSVCLSVHPSVRPSHAGIVSKRRHVVGCSLHHWIAKCV